MNYIDDVLKCLDDLLPILSSPGNEQDMYDFVRDMFISLGFVDVGLKLTKTKYQIHKMVIRDDDDNTWYERNTPNLGLSYKGDDSKPHLVFNAHLDHYFTSSTTSKRIIDGDWLVSDGKNILGADCKAGIALIYTVVKRILNTSCPPSIDIIFDTCEEAGLIGIMEFVKEKQYHAMPFWTHYKKGQAVYCYCFDGLYDIKMDKKPLIYINRASAVFISKYLINPEVTKIYDVVGEHIKSRRLNKKEQLLVSSLYAIRMLNADKILVEKYGSSLIILSKIIPTLMFPMGFMNCHTVAEKLYLPYLNTIISALECHF